MLVSQEGIQYACVCLYITYGVHSPKLILFNYDKLADHTCIDCDTCRWMAPVRI